MDRREVLKASLAGAAIGISPKRAISPDLGLQAELHSRAAFGEDIARTPLVNLYDFEAAAKRKLPVSAWEYFNGGSADEITLKRNREALDAQLEPRVLVDVTRIDTSCTLLGRKMEHPILLAPTSSHLLAHPDAETATARGATAAKAIMVASTVSNRSIEDICKSASERIWFQLYVEDDRRAVRALIERAEAAGCKALCITADNPFAYARNREERVRAQAPTLPFPNLGIEAGPGGRSRSASGGSTYARDFIAYYE